MIKPYRNQWQSKKKIINGVRRYMYEASEGAKGG